MINLQEAKEPKYENMNENSRIFHFIEVAKIKETKMTSHYAHRLKKQVYNSTWISVDSNQTQIWLQSSWSWDRD